MTDRTRLIELAERMDDFNGKVRSLVGKNEGELSANGVALALALLTTLNAATLVDVAATLRALANQENPDAE